MTTIDLFNPNGERGDENNTTTKDKDSVKPFSVKVFLKHYGLSVVMFFSLCVLCTDEFFVSKLYIWLLMRPIQILLEPNFGLFGFFLNLFFSILLVTFEQLNWLIQTRILSSYLLFFVLFPSDFLLKS